MNDARHISTSLLLAITQKPFGLDALALYLAAEAEIGPLASGFEDLLLDNIERISQRQAADIARLYRRLPHVARAIAQEQQHDAARL